MKTKIVQFKVILILLPLFSFSQDHGIKFRKDLKWQEILSLAKKENKYIFVDCYTTWCAPCKRMSLNIFPREDVGKIMNEHFINVQVQMDVTRNDNQQIKNWYNDAKELYNQYQIKAFPTLLFLSPNGHLVFRSEGADDAQAFLSAARLALDEFSRNNYETLLSKYRKGAKDSATLRNLSLLAESIGDVSFAHKVANIHIKSINNPLTSDNISYIAKFTKYPNDKGFELYNKFPEQIARIMGEGDYYAIDRAMAILHKNDSNFTNISSNPNWDSMTTNLSKKYNHIIAQKAVADFKYRYYERNNQWPQYISAVIMYINDYYPEESFTKGINYIAWNIFDHSNEPKELEYALNLSQRTLIYEPQDVYNMDTYANLLYKLGRTKDAIALQKLAVQLSGLDDREALQANLLKMTEGKKTWN